MVLISNGKEMKVLLLFPFDASFEVHLFLQYLLSSYCVPIAEQEAGGNKWEITVPPKKLLIQSRNQVLQIPM